MSVESIVAFIFYASFRFVIGLVRNQSEFTLKANQL